MTLNPNLLNSTWISQKKDSKMITHDDSVFFSDISDRSIFFTNLCGLNLETEKYFSISLFILLDILNEIYCTNI